MQFYELFEELCLKKGVTPRGACIEMGFGQSAAATWKYRGSVPTGFNMRKVAKYFGVSMDSLCNYESISSIDELKKAEPEPVAMGQGTPLEAELSGMVRQLPVVDQEKLKVFLETMYPERFK